MAKISCIHPSCRPNVAKETREKWLDLAKQPDLIEYLICADSYQDKKVRKVGVSKNNFEYYYPCINGKSAGSIKKLNFIAKLASAECLLISTDDVIPHKHWDYEILNSTNWDKDVVLRIGDDFEKSYSLKDFDKYRVEYRPYMIKHAAFSKKRLERYGFVGHPNFRHVCADDYFSWLAHKDNVVIENKKITFTHYNPLLKNAPWDKFYKEQNSKENYEKGRMIFLNLTVNTITNQEIKDLIEEYFLHANECRKLNIEFVLTCVGVDVEKIGSEHNLNFI